MRRQIFLFLFGFLIAAMAVSPAGAATPEAEAQGKVASDLLADGKCPMALAAAEKAIDLDPSYGTPWNTRGSALHCLGRNEEALESFVIALDLDPDLTVAEQNYDHVNADLLKGAPLYTPPVDIPVIRNSSIAYDGELGYTSPGVPTGSWALQKDGHAVLFHNGRTITLTGVRIAGCRYGKGDGQVRIEIWDRNFTVLSSDTIPYDQVPLPAVDDETACLERSAWVDTSLPGHDVNGDFYLVLFTGSGPASQKEPGIDIVYGTPTDAKTSFTVSTSPNRIAALKIGSAGYRAEEIDWMIRVLYTEPHSPAAGTTPAPEAPAEGRTASSPGMVPDGELPVEEPLQSPAPGPAGIAGALAVAVSWSVFRK